MLYRVLCNLDAGKRGIIPEGDLTLLEWLNEDKRQMLIAAGAVSVLQSPPLGVLPGWKARARKLGGITAGEFLELSDEGAAEALGVGVGLVAAYKDNVRSFLVVKTRSG